MNITIRKAVESDLETIHKFIYDLADYENRRNECTVTIEELRELMFEEMSINAVVAENDGEAVGMATYYYVRVTTFTGKRSLYIEDLFIKEEYRTKGIGTNIFNFIRNIAKEKHCRLMEWKCLDWDSATISFYDKMGGRISDGWLTYTLDESNF